MIVLLRETRTNRYTVNALTGILDGCDVPWRAAGSPDALALAACRAKAVGRRPLIAYSFTTPELAAVRREVAILKAAVPEVRLLAGGPHPTADPEGTVALGFHHVFVGGAERTLPAFLVAGAVGPPVAGRTGNTPEDLDAFPPFGRGRHGPVEITRGCPFGCGFCAVGGHRACHRSVASVLAAGERFREAGRRKIVFITPDALSYGGDLGTLETLLRSLSAAGLAPVLGTFPSEVRPERVTAEALALLAAHCHNRTLVIGAQSGSDQVLQRLRRGHTVADVVRAAQLARRAGFLPHVDLIFGLPQETRAERRLTLDLARRLRREAGARIHAHYFHPLPGTPLWSQDPTPLDGETRRSLLALREAGAEDGHWAEQERWAWEILDWADRGWIRAPRRPASGRGGSARRDPT